MMDVVVRREDHGEEMLVHGFADDGPELARLGRVGPRSSRVGAARRGAASAVKIALDVESSGRAVVIGSAFDEPVGVDRERPRVAAGNRKGGGRSRRRSPRREKHDFVDVVGTKHRRPIVQREHEPAVEDVERAHLAQMRGRGRVKCHAPHVVRQADGREHAGCARDDRELDRAARELGAARGSVHRGVPGRRIARPIRVNLHGWPAAQHGAMMFGRACALLGSRTLGGCRRRRLGSEGRPGPSEREACPEETQRRRAQARRGLSSGEIPRFDGRAATLYTIHQGSMGDLSQRARKILFSCITEFIATGDPVGSRTLARKYSLDLSAASIRNVLADLEEAGYLEQPHTSAGRIPTERAFRFFIDALIELRSVSPAEQAGITQRFAEIYAIADDPLRATAKHLSELSGGAAVIGATRPELRTLSQLRFIPTRPGQILAVLVFTDGTVENRFVAIEAPFGASELERVHNLLADVIEGRSLGDVRDLFARRLADERVVLDTLRRRAFELAQQATAELDRPAEVVIEGQARLLDLPEYGTDVGRMRKLVHALEEREELVELLDRTLVAGVVTVYVGRESGELGDAQLSLVVAPYGRHGQAAGAVGVIGPTRMDYAKVMPLVNATATAMSQAIDRGKGST